MVFWNLGLDTRFRITAVSYTHLATAPTGFDMLRIATRGSASLLGRDDLGYIAPGMAADFFLIDSNRLELTGTLQDVAAIPATVGFKGSVDYTVVNGRIVVKEGHLVNVDEDKLVEQANLSVARYLNQN